MALFRPSVAAGIILFSLAPAVAPPARADDNPLAPGLVVMDAMENAAAPRDKGRTIKGIVIDSRGQPAPGAVVAATRVVRGSGETRTDSHGRFTLPGISGQSRILAARESLFGAVSITGKTTSVLLHLSQAKKQEGSAAEDRLRAAAIIRDIKKRYLEARRRGETVDDFVVSSLPQAIAPFDFPLALELAKPDEASSIDDQTLAQMIREVAQQNPERLHEWAIPALKEIREPAVRASAAYAVVIVLPEGPVRKVLAKQVYEEMKRFTLDGSEQWIIRRVTQMAVLAQILGLPEESQAWLTKAIEGATSDETKPYLSVVAFESVNAGLPFVRQVLAKADPKQRADLYWETLPRLARLNARAAQKLLTEREMDSSLPGADPKRDDSCGEALMELVRALAAQDPSAAAQVADKLRGSDYEPAALCLSARGLLDGEKRARLYRRAASIPEAARSGEILAKIASRAWGDDPALARNLFDRAKQAVEKQNFAPDTYGSVAKATIAEEFAEHWPGESRLILTAATDRLMSPEGRREDRSGSYRQSLALAWLPFRVDQALAVAESISGKPGSISDKIRTSTLTRIAIWLLADPQKRNKQLLSDYDPYGFDPRDYGD